VLIALCQFAFDGLAPGHVRVHCNRR
jgi:hypothetical protein